MSRIFVDTNILVYASDESSSQRDGARRLWQKLLISQDTPVLSTQVLQEYYNTLTRKLRVSPEDAEERLKRLNEIEAVQVSREVIFQAAALHRTASVSFWDALIVSSAQIAGCSELWSEDMQDGQKFGTLEIVNPFQRR